MDLQQRKLNRSEWNSIEISVSKTEIDILHILTSGFHDVNIRVNNNNSIFTFLKIEYSEKMEDYLYNKYLRGRCDKIETVIKKLFNEEGSERQYKIMKITSDVKINSADKIRLERFNETMLVENDIYEFTLLNQIEKIIHFRINNNKKLFHFNYNTFYNYAQSKNPLNNIYTNVCLCIYKFFESSFYIIHYFTHIIELSNQILRVFETEIEISVIIENAVDFVEKNDNILKYGDLTLYEHQKEIFTICKQPNPKLVLYMAPTGTGKTLTPIALSEQKKIIFVCAARHVGLALARSAISINKRVAFAFGCASADDIRLHYFAAKEFTRNKRTGGIGKVDNSVGDNVEIMICDIKSYLPAMYYMLAFFPPEEIVFYWDEPTISLDYSEHEFHATIQKNWSENTIPNIVLSSATLPKENELMETIPDFLNKFEMGKVYNIISHDCKKSIPIINKDGYVVLPHYLQQDYTEVLKIAEHCKNYLTLLRYFDLKEVVEFISYINLHKLGNSKTGLERHFEILNDINMKNIKMYYINLLLNIVPEKWTTVFTYFTRLRQPRIFENNAIDTKGNKIVKIKSVGPGIPRPSQLLSGTPLRKISSEQIVTSSSPSVETRPGTSGVYVTTKDAYTLTDGPTIFISDNVEKIAKFCIQQANIPSTVMDEIMKKIEYNNVINIKLSELESEIDQIKDASDKAVQNDVSGFHGGIKVSGRNKSNKDSKKLSRDLPADVENKSSLSKLTQEINSLRSMIKSSTLNDAFVPNKKMHLNKWASDIETKKSFTSNVDEQTVSDIMALKGVDNSWKILLMMGIGVFINHENISYTEIMKRLADEQKLYMIIASSDYIYGTNYQFCHGFLSKDLQLTQEKVIQAMGRIGRNNIQQTYTVRFRDDEQILKLFTSETDKPEIINMNRLFNSRKVVWRDNEYVEMEN